MENLQCEMDSTGYLNHKPMMVVIGVGLGPYDQIQVLGLGLVT